ncbi:MAG: tRNA lysidine(34) synthetase TilS [Candidatus Omnitrophica bacterium]|nr:tRNA lysidine(34) synthetase TilS [Candidatus Omnitrophota bacterium]
MLGRLLVRRYSHSASALASSRLASDLDSVERTNRRRGLFKKGESLLLAVSGGPDSVALLALLSKLRRKYRLGLNVAHLNHGFLPRQGRRHARFTKILAREFRAPYYEKTVALRSLAKKLRRSLEETGRVARYRFFEEAAARAGCGKIVTAHTLDDQAETVLMRLVRGTGIRGLGGIPFKRKSGRFEVIRPLLNCRKKDLVSFLKESGIKYCSDRSNQDPRFFRNRIRRRLLPWIEAHGNPGIKEALASLRNISEEIQGHLDAVSARAFKKCLLRRSRARLVLDEARLRRLPPAVLKEVFLRAAGSLVGHTKKIDYAHLEALADLLKSPNTSLQTHWPSGLVVRKRRGRLEFLSRN